MQKQNTFTQQNNQPELPEADVVLDSYGTTSLPMPNVAPIYCLTILRNCPNYWKKFNRLHDVTAKRC